LAAEAQHGPDEVAASWAVDPGRPDDVAAIVQCQRLPLAPQFGAAVDAQGIRLVPFEVRLAFAPLEDVVRGHVHGRRPDLARRARAVAGAQRVRPVGSLGVALAAVDVGVGAGVDDDGRIRPLDRPTDGALVGQVKVRAGAWYNVVARERRG